MPAGDPQCVDGPEPQEDPDRRHGAEHDEARQQGKPLEHFVAAIVLRSQLARLCPIVSKGNEE